MDVIVTEPAETQPSEEVAEAAVEIAEIEAEARVEIAAIEAETQVAAIEASERSEAWQMELDGLRASLGTNVAALSESVMQHEAQINNLTETVTMQAAALAALTQEPPSESEPEPVPPAEAPAAPEEAEPEPTQEPARRKRVWM